MCKNDTRDVKMQERIQEFLKGGGGGGSRSSKRQVRRNLQTDKKKNLGEG